jgi:hypothetical protein
MAKKKNTQSLQQPPAPDPELRRLEPLLGAWEAEDHTQDSIAGPGVPVTNWEEFLAHVG